MLPPLVGVLRGNISHFVASMGEAKTAAASASGFGATAFQGMAAVGKVAFLGVAGGAIAAGAISVKMAGDFQESMTKLVTGAGESRKNLDLVSKGLLSMSSQVGVSAQDLANGMYTIESAGFHGAAGLNVMKIAAQGAKVGGADMSIVADALTSALNAYHLPASKAVNITNDLVATVANGKMRMQDLAGALGTVLPAASTAKVSLAEVTGAIATMTMQGTPAADAATYLRQTILQMENPSAKAQKALKDVGLGARQLASDLGKKGLAATLQEATEAIGKKFAPGSSEYISHLADMVGGTKSMQAALELTGRNMTVFEANTKNIASAAKRGGGEVAGWAETQKDFNFMIDQAKAFTGALAIQIGLRLIPFIEQGVQKGQQFVGYLKSHTETAKMLAAAIAGPLLIAIGFYTVSMIAAAVATIAATWPIILIVLALAALSAAVVYAYGHWGWFRNAVNLVGTDLRRFMGWLGKEVPPIWAGFTKLVGEAWDGLKKFGSWISNTFGPILKAMGDALSKAGGFLNSINPWAKHSPSLVENVESGTRQIVGHYATMARSVQGSMQSLNGSVQLTGSNASLSGAGLGSAGSVTSGAGSRTEELLTRILDALLNPSSSGATYNVSGAGMSIAALARAIAQEQAFAMKVRPSH